MYHLSGRSLGESNARYSGRQFLGGGTVSISYPGNSARYRSIVRATLGGLGCGCKSSGFAGLGDTAQVQSSAQYASLGAKAGSVVPGVGTVIGAALGAVYGYIKGKKKPTRPSKQDKENCRGVMKDYEALIAPYPNQAIGGALPEESMKAVWMCDEMVNAGTTPNPLYLEGNWQLAKEMAIEAVTKTFRTPAGSPILLTTKGRRDRDGKLFREVNEQWINGEANTMNAIAAKLASFFSKGCLSYHKASKCDPINNRALWRHMVLDLVGWAAATQIPQVVLPTDADAALPGAPTAPAPAPVTAVNTAPPPVSLPAPVPVVPAVPTPQTPGAVAPVPAPTGAPPGAYENQLAAQMAPLIQQLISQGADQKTAFSAALSQLAQSGVQPTAAVQSAVANQVQSATQINPWIIVGGGLAAAIAIYALAGKRA